MKRFHAHVHVDDLAQSIAFYSKLFAAAPARVVSAAPARSHRPEAVRTPRVCPER